MKSVLYIAAALLALTPVLHAEVNTVYTPGGPEWAKTWKAFYAGDHEEDLPKPLIKAGSKMVPAILEAIAHKDMQQRRYAISALGNIHDRRAIAPLTAILEDKSEEEYFRGDALVAIYQIDQTLGTQLAEKYVGEGDTLKTNSQAILAKEPWLAVGSADTATPIGVCDATAYVIDPDKNGLNVRSAPRTGSIVGNIPKDSEGTIVHLIAQNSNGGWVQLDRATTVAEKVVFDKKGWISGNMLGVSTRGYGTKGVSLYTGVKGDTVITTIPPETQVTVMGCDGARLQVKYKGEVGWLKADDQCDSPVTNCN